MLQGVEVELEEWAGSPVIRVARSDYTRLPAAAYRYKPAQLTARQAVFLRNLVRLAQTIGKGDIPVDFIGSDGTRRFLDRGCVTMAVHAGFLLDLIDGPTGVVDSVRLSWDVSGERRSPSVPE